MVQGIVTRMANNSAQTKTWTVPLITSIYVISGLSKNPHWMIVVGGCIAVIAFWFLDARYLYLERCYIKLYEAVLCEESTKLFDLNYRPYTTKVDSIWKVAISWSVCAFYGSLLMAMFLLFIITYMLGAYDCTQCFL